MMASMVDNDKYPMTARMGNRARSAESALVCPLNLELPIEPVTAEDGLVYERDAIEKYFVAQAAGDATTQVPSPVVGTRMMGQTLLPAPLTRKTIEALIENGLLTGELATKWKVRDGLKKYRAELLQKAQGGDVNAMKLVARGYTLGRYEFHQDYQKAYQWAQKAHAAGSVYGMALVGQSLLSGRGAEKDTVKGVFYLSVAEEKGSDVSSCVLGLHWATGVGGFSVDKVLARQMLEKCLNENKCRYHDMGEEGKEVARRKLDELTLASQTTQSGATKEQDAKRTVSHEDDQEPIANDQELISRLRFD